MSALAWRSYTRDCEGTKYWMNERSDFMIPVFTLGSMGEGDVTTVTTSGRPCAWRVRRRVSPHGSTSTSEESAKTM